LLEKRIVEVARDSGISEENLDVLNPNFRIDILLEYMAKFQEQNKVEFKGGRIVNEV